MKPLKYIKPTLFGLFAAIACLPLVHAQGVAPAVSIMYNGNYVSATNPLPVIGLGGIGSIIGLPPVNATTAANVTTVQDFALPQNLKDQGAVCDGTTDDSAVINATTFPNQNVPLTNCFASEAFTAFPPGQFFGFGHTISRESAANHARANNTISVTATPAACAGDYSEISYSTAFDCSFGIYNAMNVGEYIAPNAAPSPSGYTTYPYLNPIYVFLNNNGGRQGYSGNVRNGNRTNFDAVRVKLINTGQGDVTAFFCKGFVNSTPAPNPTPSDFLGNAVTACLAEDLFAGADGDYMHGGDNDATDNGHDASYVDIAVNNNRTNNTGANGVIWTDFITQDGPGATKQIDASYADSSMDRISIDLAARNWNSPSPGPAIAIQAGDSVSLNCSNTTGPNGEHFSRYTICSDTGIEYNGASGLVEIHNNGHVWGFPSADPSPAATATGCGAPVTVATTNPFTPNYTVKVPVCTVLYASTGNASPAPTGTPYLQVNCAANSVSCTGAGTLTVVTGTNTSGNSEWMATVTEASQESTALTGETITLCVSASPAVGSNLVGNPNSTGAICRDALTGRIFGGVQWGTNPALYQTIIGKFVIANNVTQTFGCFIDTSTAGAAPTFTWCDVKVEPY